MAPTDIEEIVAYAEDDDRLQGEYAREERRKLSRKREEATA